MQGAQSHYSDTWDLHHFSFLLSHTTVLVQPTSLSLGANKTGPSFLEAGLHNSSYTVTLVSLFFIE